MESHRACSAWAAKVHKAISTLKTTKLTYEDVTCSKLTNTHQRRLLRLERCGISTLAARADFGCRLCERSACNSCTVVTRTPILSIDIWAYNIINCRPLLEAHVWNLGSILGSYLNNVGKVLVRVGNNLVLGKSVKTLDASCEATAIDSYVLNLDPILSTRSTISETELGHSTAIGAEPDALSPRIDRHELYLDITLLDDERPALHDIVMVANLNIACCIIEISKIRELVRVCRDSLRAELESLDIYTCEVMAHRDVGLSNIVLCID